MNRIKQAEDRRAKVLDISEEKLDAVAAVDIRTVDINTLTDIRDIKIDTKLPVEEKLASFARQTNNIYVHRMGDYVIKVSIEAGKVNCVIVKDLSRFGRDYIESGRYIQKIFPALSVLFQSVVPSYQQCYFF